MRNGDWTKEELEVFYDGIYDKLVLAQRRGNLLLEKMKEIESECDFSIEKEKTLSKNITNVIEEWRALDK